MIALLAVLAAGGQTLTEVPYCTVDGKTLTLNADLPVASKPTPAMVDIHGGWFYGGGPSQTAPDFLKRKGVAFFSIAYRLGAEGGFPQNIRDCRNAVRFVRKNARRFNIDPDRIAVMGGSAGGHLSLMVAMVPERFDDGGPTEDLKGISARVCGAFSWIPPTDFVRFWREAPSDVVQASDGKTSFRGPDEAIPNDARPRLRALFHGLTPEEARGRAMYLNMSPMGHVRSRIPPLLVCDGEGDPIVPGQHGKALYDRLRKIGADCAYWLTPEGGHGFPGGVGFDAVLNGFLDRIYGLPTPASKVLDSVDFAP